MNHAVWKYDVPFPCDFFVLYLLTGAQPLHVAEQDGKFQMWVLVAPEITTTSERIFRWCGTGHEIREPIITYISTILQPSATRVPFVWHVFEVQHA